MSLETAMAEFRRRTLERQRDMAALCKCGKRRGLHRHDTDWCPNPNWRPCGSHGEWLPTQSFEAESHV